VEKLRPPGGIGKIMKTLDWYILKKFLGAYVFVVFIIVSIVVIINYTDYNDSYLKHNLGFREIAGYYLTFIPYIASLISPITVFIAVVFITSKLAQHTEIIAMLSSGMSFRRLMRPYFIGALIIAVVWYYFAGWVIPDSNKSRVAFELQYVKTPYINTDRDIHIKIGPESYLYMQNFNNQANVGYRFTLETIVGTQVRDRLFAQRIEWQEETQSWKLKNWTLRSFNDMEEKYATGFELDTVLRIHPRDFESDYGRYETLTMDELSDYISELELRGADNIQIYQIEKYIRYMSPFAAFVLTFIGLILSSRKQRGGVGFQIALGFLLAFIYIILYIFARSVAEAGSTHPVIAVWSPNIVFGLIGLLLYKTVPR
jgi:lipopolysaccharide export system permease protein